MLWGPDELVRVLVADIKELLLRIKNLNYLKSLFCVWHIFADVPVFLIRMTDQIFVHFVKHVLFRAVL